MVDILGLLQGVPLFVGILILVSYLFWAHCFSKEGKSLIPKKSEDLISIFLIFLYFFVGLISIYLLFFLTLQIYTFTFNLELAFRITQYCIIVVSFIFLLIIAGHKKEQTTFVYGFFRIFKLILFSSFVITGALWGIFYSLDYVNWLYSLLFTFLGLVLGVVFYFIQNITSQNLFDLNNIHKPEKISYSKKEKRECIFAIIMLVVFLVSFIFVLFTQLSSTNNIGSSFIERQIIERYSDYNPYSLNVSETNYSIKLGANSEKINLKLDPNYISFDDELTSYFLIGFIKNNSKVGKSFSSSSLNKDIYGSNITRIVLKGEILEIYFNSSFIKSGYDKVYVRGAVKENISGLYQVSGIKTHWGLENNKIVIDFQINNSLKERNVQEYEYVFSFPYSGKNTNDCVFDNNMPLFLDDELCNFKLNSGDNHCSGNYCSGKCKNWNIQLDKGDSTVVYSSYNNGELGSLRIRAYLSCI